VIVITSVDDERIHHQLLSMGAHAYLRKPFDRKQLFDIVLEIIQPSEIEVPEYMKPEYMKNVTDQDMKLSVKEANCAEDTEGLILVGAYE
ncbi:hypothetical protein H8E77_09915, partial [bacterium]|nr:hypothetical protein [bacterium]